MGISSAQPTSRRGYLSRAELAQFADITVTDTAEADDRISQAEEIIDTYVGFINKFIPTPIKGRCSTAGGSTTLYLKSTDLDVYENDYFVGCEVEIVGGTGAGQRRRVTASVKTSGLITVADAWTTNPDTTSFYSIYQLGKFPRYQDMTYYTDEVPYQYYRSIPEAVKRAVASQVEFLIQMGDDFFRTDKSLKESETIASYSYNNSSSGTPLHRMIAPKAKLLLSGLVNRVGEMVV